GLVDVAVTGPGDGKVRLLLGTSHGTLQAWRSSEAPLGGSAMVAVDGDLMWANTVTGTLSRMRVSSDGTLVPRVATTSTTTLVSSPTSSATFGQAVTLTATVSPAAATGKV